MHSAKLPELNNLVSRVQCQIKEQFFAYPHFPYFMAFLVILEQTVSA